MSRKSKKSAGPERAFDVTLLPEKYTLADLERMVGISQADSEVPDAGPNNPMLPKPGEDCRTLPPLPPEDANLSIPDQAAELRPVMALFPQAQAVIEYGMKHPLSGEQRRRLTIAFDNERAAVQRILEDLVGGLHDIPVQHRTEWHRQLTDVCSRLVELVSSCLPDRKIDIDRLDCLYREYLDVLGQTGFFVNVQTNEMEREHVRFVRDFLRQRRAHDAAETGAGNQKVHIDLSQWRKGTSRNLLQDLLLDVLRKGVTIKPKRHGKNAAKELRRTLRDHKLPRVAEAVKRVKGKPRTYRLDIADDNIAWDMPKT